MPVEPIDPVPDAIEALVFQCLQADEPRVALERLCGEYPEHEVGLRRRFALAAGMGLATGAAASDPTHIGDFLLIRELGRGGMGIVWLAVQQSLGRKVALKLLRPGFGTEGFAKRLRHEAAVLGQLRHVGIAHVYEAGTAVLDQGYEQPFFAMEYVDGRPLDVYARERGPDFDERLALLAQVADAVAHAHAHGVIHRDLKPDNILVDADGQPKILDFGIARLTDSDVASVTMQTATGELLGTIPYMSPEQVLGDSRAIDARTDVYALGAILYELLAGRVPIDVRDKSIAEAARRICDEDPTRLSTLDTRFRGDVETIVGKALAKEKERRYLSVAEFAADIRRYLHKEPIHARPTSAFYYLRKFASRHRGLFGGLLAAFLILIVGVVVAVSFGIRADRNAEIAQRQSYSMTLFAAESALRDHDIVLARRQLEAVAEARRGWEWLHLHSRLDDSVRILDAPEGESFELSSLPDQPSYLVTIRTGAGTRARRFDPWAGTWAPADERPQTADAWWTERLRAEPDLPSSGERRIWNVLADGQRAVAWVGEARGNKTFWLLDRREGIPARRLMLPPETLRRVPVGGRRLCTATPARAFVVDLEGPFSITPLPEYSSEIYCLAAAPDGRTVAIGYTDGAVWLCSATGRLLEVNHSQRGAVYRLRFFDEGKLLASAAWDGTVRIFDARRLYLLRTLHGHHEPRLTRLEVAGDGSTLATRGYGDETQWRFWDARPTDPRVLRGHSSYVYPIAFGPKGKVMVSGGWVGNASGEVLLWDTQKRNSLHAPLVTSTGHVSAVAISPDGHRLATLDSQHRLRVWDMDDLHLIAERPDYFCGEGDTANGPLTFHPDSNRMLWPTAESIEVWSIDGDETVPATPDFLRELRGGHAAPDGSVVALYAENELRSYDAESRTEIAAFPLPPGHRTFSFFRDPRGRLRLLLTTADTAAATRLGTSRPGDSPQQLRRVAAPRAVAVVDPRTGRTCAVLRGHGGEVLGVAASPDGTRIATGGRDDVVRIWDAETFEELVALRGHGDYVFALAWSPDGSMLASTSGDGSVRIWGTRSVREIVAAARGVSVEAK